MYAIVEIAGQQFKVSKDQKVYVHRLPNAEDEKVTFSNVLLIDNNGAVTVGAPAINGASVEAKVLKHLKGDNVLDYNLGEILTVSVLHFVTFTSFLFEYEHFVSFQMF